jgi:hypothetical protein
MNLENKKILVTGSADGSSARFQGARRENGSFSDDEIVE